MGTVQKSSSRGIYSSSQGPSPTLEDLRGISRNLISNSLAQNTKNTYSVALHKLDEFRDLYNLPKVWPIPCHDLLNFVSYLVYKATAVSTISTYLSAISYTHKLSQATDTTKSFLVSKAIEGARRNRGNSLDTRAPITLDILEQMMKSLPHICQNSYEECLFKAAFSLAFFGLLRIGEFTQVNNKAASKKVIKYQDVEITQKQLNVTIKWSKTDQCGKSIVLQISKNDKWYCPVACMSEYLKFRQNKCNNDLFIHLNGKSLTRYQFNAMMTKSLKFIKSEGHFRSHSFRMGVLHIWLI